VGETKTPMESVELFCSGRENLTSVTPENHILFALSLTSNMKDKAIKRMKEVNNDYLKNEKKYKAEGKTLCHLQHEKYIKFYDVFKQGTKKKERYRNGGALQRDDKGKTYYFDSGKEYVIYESTLDQIYCLLTNLYKSVRFQIVCDDEDVNFVVHKGRIRKRKPKHKKKNKDKK
jgi:serine/threonine protein kinase